MTDLRRSLRAALRRRYARPSIHEIEPTLWRVSLVTDDDPPAIAQSLASIIPLAWVVVGVRRSPRRGRVSVTLRCVLAPLPFDPLDMRIPARRFNTLIATSSE